MLLSRRYTFFRVTVTGRSHHVRLWFLPAPPRGETPRSRSCERVTRLRQIGHVAEKRDLSVGVWGVGEVLLQDPQRTKLHQQVWDISASGM